MESFTTPEPPPVTPDKSSFPVGSAKRSSIQDVPDSPDLHSVPDLPDDARVGDDRLIEAHLGRMSSILQLPSDQARAVAATHYLATLEDCRRDAIAVRDVSVRTMNTSGLGGVRIAAALGLNASRGQQLIYRAQQTHLAAAQHIARLRRRLALHER